MASWSSSSVKYAPSGKMDFTYTPTWKKRQNEWNTTFNAQKAALDTLGTPGNPYNPASHDFSFFPNAGLVAARNAWNSEYNRLKSTLGQPGSTAAYMQKYGNQNGPIDRTAIALSEASPGWMQAHGPAGGSIGQWDPGRTGASTTNPMLSPGFTPDIGGAVPGVQPGMELTGMGGVPIEIIERLARAFGGESAPSQLYGGGGYGAAQTPFTW